MGESQQPIPFQVGELTASRPSGPQKGRDFQQKSMHIPVSVVTSSSSVWPSSSNDLELQREPGRASGEERIRRLIREEPLTRAISSDYDTVSLATRRSLPPYVE